MKVAQEIDVDGVTIIINTDNKLEAKIPPSSGEAFDPSALQQQITALETKATELQNALEAANARIQELEFRVLNLEHTPYYPPYPYYP